MSGHSAVQKLVLPRLYAILDVDCLSRTRASATISTAQISKYALELAAGGVTLLQYRAKSLSAREMLSHARELKRILSASVKLIMNDRTDLCLAAGFAGVHLGQDDLSPEGARKLVGEQHWIGVSTHNLEQLALADASSADYLAIGPIFGTQSKQNPDPVVGLDGLRAARKATRKPLVAIGGITRENCRSVIDTGADSVAVISDLVNEPRRSAEEFLRILM
jgi:thiamine-phosphate pyrophosphorylase